MHIVWNFRYTRLKIKMHIQYNIGRITTEDRVDDGIEHMDAAIFVHVYVKKKKMKQLQLQFQLSTLNFTYKIHVN